MKLLPVIGFLMTMVKCQPWKEPMAITFPELNEGSLFTREGAEVDLVQISARYEQGIKAVQSVAMLVQKVLLDETTNSSARNWVVSPIGLASILGQLFLGARGNLRTMLGESLSLVNRGQRIPQLETHRQLGELMKYLQQSTSYGYLLKINQALFIQPDIILKPEFKYALMDLYNIEMVPLDFLGKPENSIEKINDWVKSSTLGHLSKLLPYPLPPSTMSLLANIVYYKGNWDRPFDPKLTKPGMFHFNETHKVQIEFMVGEQQILYADWPEYQVLGIPFEKSEVVMYVLLPYTNVPEKISKNRLNEFLTSVVLRNVTLVFPKFNLFSTISVRESIINYFKKKDNGADWKYLLSDIFERKGDNLGNLENHKENDSSYVPEPLPLEVNGDHNDFDMGCASNDVRFKFDDVLHQISVEINEKGSEIAAITSTLVDYSGEIPVIRINRPFLFLIRHEITLAHMFWGYVVNPS